MDFLLREYSIFDGQYRIMKDLDWTDETLLFDILIDPQEEENIAPEHPELVAGYEALIELLTQDVGPDVEPEYDPETEEMLRSLGYLN